MADEVVKIRKLLDEVKDEGLALLTKFESNAISAKDVLTGDWYSQAHALRRKTAAVMGQVTTAVTTSPSMIVARSLLEEFGPAVRGACSALWLRRFVGKDVGADYDAYPPSQYEPVSVIDARHTFNDVFTLAKQLLNLITGESSYLPALQQSVAETAGEQSPTSMEAGVKPRRGPMADIANHKRVAEIVNNHPGPWRTDTDLLDEICKDLDAQNIPRPSKWNRWKPKPQSWKRAAEYDRQNVIKYIEYRLKWVAKHTS